MFSSGSGACSISPVGRAGLCRYSFRFAATPRELRPARCAVGAQCHRPRPQVARQVGAIALHSRLSHRAARHAITPVGPDVQPARPRLVLCRPLDPQLLRRARADPARRVAREDQRTEFAPAAPQCSRLPRPRPAQRSNRHGSLLSAIPGKAARCFSAPLPGICGLARAHRTQFEGLASSQLLLFFHHELMTVQQDLEGVALRFLLACVLHAPCAQAAAESRCFSARTNVISALKSCSRRLRLLGNWLYDRLPVHGRVDLRASPVLDRDRRRS